MADNNTTINFNEVQKTGTFGSVVDILNSNFNLAKEAILQMRGKSAYEIWKEQEGNENKTQEEFLASLRESGFTEKAVSERPTTGEEKTIYAYTSGVNQWSEAIYVDGEWLVLATHTGNLSSVPQIGSSNNYDLAFVDENGNSVVVFGNGHVKTQKFDSSKAVTTQQANEMVNGMKEEIETSGKLASVVQLETVNIDFAITDEKGYPIVIFQNGHVKTQNFDSENIIANSGKVVEFPQFMGYGLDNTTGAKTASTTRLTSTWVRASKDDTVEVLDATKIVGFKVYEYASINGTLITKSESFSTDKYTVQSTGTKFIRILGVKDDATTLYTNKDFRNNIFVTHINAIEPADDKLMINSTIPDGWYVSQHSEFVVDDEHIYINRPNSELDNEIPLADLYAAYDALLAMYGENGSNALEKGYITKETLGKDETNTYDILKYTFKPRAVETVDSGLSRGVNDDTLPKIFLESCIHGVEKPCARALINFLIHLCNNWKNDKYLEWIRWNVELVVIPVANPYGYVNNTRGNGNVPSGTSYGVDLNRNFPANGGWDRHTGTSINTDNWKGVSACSENETKCIVRTLLENSDAIAAYDLHTHGSFEGGWKVMTRFDYGNSVFLGNVLSAVGNELTKGFTVSGITNHGMGDPTPYATTEFNYFGQVGSSNPNVGFFANEGLELGIPTASPEVTYLRRHFDVVACGNIRDSYKGTHYCKDTDSMNEEYVANLVLMTIRQRFIQNKK